jgi:hypothetical protein
LPPSSEIFRKFFPAQPGNFCLFLTKGQKQREQSEAAMRELSQASVPETFEAVTNNNLQ